VNKTLKLYARDRQRASLLLSISERMASGQVALVPAGGKLTEVGVFKPSEVTYREVVPVYVDVPHQHTRLIRQIAQDLIDYD